MTRKLQDDIWWNLTDLEVAALAMWLKWNAIDPSTVMDIEPHPKGWTVYYTENGKRRQQTKDMPNPPACLVELFS